MAYKKKLLLSWSSGKDSAWCLHLLRERGEYQIVGLVTTFNRAFNRVAMHSTRRAVVELQAEAAGLPLIAVPLPWPCSNAEYEQIMSGVCRDAVAQGVAAIAFGDLFLQDIRAYREKQLQGTGLQPVFPLWQIPTDRLAEEMIAGGLRARLVCVDPQKLSPDFAGRNFDRQLLADLPAGIDRCGENGEFHTCVYAGPMFDGEIPVCLGERVERDGACFLDLLPAAAVTPVRSLVMLPHPARSNPSQRLGIAWLALTCALALHVLDEALTGFLPIYNATVLALRASYPWFPMPTFSFPVWLTGLVLLIVAMFAISPNFFRDRRWVRPIAYFMSLMNALNALGHTTATVFGRTAGAIHFARPAPGFYSSPLLFGASIGLLVALRSSRKNRQAATAIAGD